jgi:opacity protein-like surface antigen
MAQDTPRPAAGRSNRAADNQQRMKNQALAISICALLALGAMAPAHGQAGAQREGAGFYGGIAAREASGQSNGVQIGRLDSAWGKFTSPLADESTPRALLFGGYRWTNDVAIEASVATAERYALRPDDALGRRGVGLSLMPADPSPRRWNADVYTSWSFLRRFAVYGRLGYAQADASAVAPYGPLPDARRSRDGVNYGVGVRYDVNPALGLRLEYARFGRFAGETLQSGVLPDSDQVQLGVQLRF